MPPDRLGVARRGAADPPPPRGAVGRGDLLCLLPMARGAEGGLAALAGLAGFERRAPTPEEPHRPPREAPSTAGPLPARTPAPEPPRAAVSGLPLYRVTGWRSLPRTRRPGEYPDWLKKARPLPDDLPKRFEAPSEPEPLVPWRRLWPFLRAALGELSERPDPDLERLVELIARGRFPRRLPQRRRQRWAPACRVILDFSPHLEPFHGDLRNLIRPLRRLRGPLGLDLLMTQAGADGPFVPLPRRAGRPPGTVPELPGPGTPVLVVGDLGVWGDSAARLAWVRLGGRLSRIGIRPIALIPCPPRRWDRGIADLYRLFVWDRPRRLPRGPLDRPAAARAWPGSPMPSGAVPGSRSDSEAGAERLLDLLAPAVRIEPALIRALRLGLKGPGMDVGAEMAAWLHPDLVHKEPAPEWRDRETVERRRTAYAAHPAEDRALAAELLEWHHRCLAPSIRAEEADSLARLQARLDPDAAARLADTVRTWQTAEGAERERLRRYAARFGERQDAAALGDERRAALWTLGNLEAVRAGTCAFPPGFDVRRVDWLLSGTAEPRVYTLFQAGETLRVLQNPPLEDVWGARPDGPRSMFGTDPIPGSPLAELRLTEAPLQYVLLDEPEPAFGVPPGVGAEIPLRGGGVQIRGWDAELTIESLTRPDWAEAIGRDGSGLFADIREGEGTRRLRWLAPGPSLSIDTEPGMRALPAPWGAWWDETALQTWLHGEDWPPAWASRSGMDDDGRLWAEIQLKGAVQRFRWIWPGEFRMGSPQDEPGRWDGETPHTVLLTRGLWLADTPCTQALWQAVMGKNPSGFKSPDRPVEQVTWDDVQTFVERLNLAVPGLAARLPSEAEWEYACRAGTETALYTGPIEILGQNNAPALDPIAWYGGNSGEGFDLDKGYDSSRWEDKQYPSSPSGTHPVGRKAPNPWGLYDMLGNVWEWCLDWQAAYPDGNATDPAGPQAGMERVVRGGGWIDVAGHCRSAQRHSWHPGFSYHDLGFRLARGPSPRPAEPGPAEPEQGPGGARNSQAPAGPDPDPNRGRGSGLGQSLRGAWRRLTGG